MTVVATLALTSQADALDNASFEAPDASGGDVGGTADWNSFNAVFTVSSLNQDNPAPVRTGTQSLKTFGPFSGANQAAGVTQRTDALPGQTWVGEIYAQSFSADPLQGNDVGLYKIEFLNAGGTLVSGVPGGALGLDTFLSNELTASDNLDEWIKLGVGTAPAPAGTAFVQVVALKLAVDGFNGGSIFWDDASLFLANPQVPEPASFALLGLGAVGLMTARRQRK